MKSDVQLQREVAEELAWDPSVNASDVGVQVRDGIVTLTGHLRSFSEKHSAEAAVKRVSGVRALAVELDVQLPAEAERVDSDIAWAASLVLANSTVVPADQVWITVERGHVTLTGEVDWDYQRIAAAHAVGCLHGVKGVVNGITIRPALTNEDIRRGIEEGLKRQAIAHARQIRVAVDGNTVTLSGEVRSWLERAAVSNAVWSARGVTRVVDDLRVNPVP